MDISKIDQNFCLKTSVDREDIVWKRADEAPFVVYGAASSTPYLRMPSEIAKTVSEGVSYLNSHTAGVRLRFRTDSQYIAIHCEWRMLEHMAHMPISGSSGFDLFAVQSDGKQALITRPFIPPTTASNGYDSIVDVRGEMTDYILNFPLYNGVEKLYIGVQADCKFETPARYSNALPVVFYGSSITQGGCASRPGNCYQNFLSRALDMDYINLGFSGSAKAEDTMIEYLASLEQSVFVCDYDHNAPSIEHLQNTHYKLYQAIRAHHPDLPYIMISKPDFRPTTNDIARREVIMESYQKALANGDKQVYFIDGGSMFTDEERDAHTVDGCHPNDLGFYRMAQAIYSVLKRLLNK